MHAVYGLTGDTQIDVTGQSRAKLISRRALIDTLIVIRTTPEENL